MYRAKLKQLFDLTKQYPNLHVLNKIAMIEYPATTRKLAEMSGYPLPVQESTKATLISGSGAGTFRVIETKNELVKALEENSRVILPYRCDINQRPDNIRVYEDCVKKKFIEHRAADGKGIRQKVERAYESPERSRIELSTQSDFLLCCKLTLSRPYRLEEIRSLTVLEPYAAYLLTPYIGDTVSRMVVAFKAGESIKQLNRLKLVLPASEVLYTLNGVSRFHPNLITVYKTLETMDASHLLDEYIIKTTVADL